METKPGKLEEHTFKHHSPMFQVFLFWLSASGAVVYGLYTANDLQWLCDDIFITFRYAENILAGNGWVYNVGERVEGYTHFLWLCLITFFQWLGAHPEETVKTIGLLAYGGTLVVFLMITYSQWDKRALTLPLTTAVLAIHYDFTIWSSSGMETMLFTFLIAVSFYCFFYWKTKLLLRLLVTGLGATLVLLTRPDGAIFFFALSLFVAASVWNEQKLWNRVVRNFGMYLIPFITLYIPITIWKISYYGYFFPNTYYAKSGDLTYWSQGFYYIWTYLQAYISSLSFVLVFVVIYFWWIQQEQDSTFHRVQRIFSDPSIAPLAFSLTFILMYGVIFIAKVGGDFMYARFLHPLIPFSYFLLEASLNRFPRIPKLWYLVLLIIFPLFVSYEKSRRDDLFFERNGKIKDPMIHSRGIIDEYWFWTHDDGSGNTMLKTQSQTGRMLGEFFRDLPVKILLKGQASLGYYGKFSHCIDDCGLTDATIAHLPLQKRARPGHEKIAPLEYLERVNVDFLFQRFYESIPSYRKVTFRTGDQIVRAALITYNAPLLTTLKNRFPQDFFYTDFTEYLDDYLSNVSTRTKSDMEIDYKKFCGFYFSHTNDTLRENRFRLLLTKPAIQ